MSKEQTKRKELIKIYNGPPSFIRNGPELKEDVKMKEGVEKK